MQLKRLARPTTAKNAAPSVKSAYSPITATTYLRWKNTNEIVKKEYE